MAEAIQPTAAILADYDRLISSMGVVAWTDRTLLELTGKDRATFLHNFCTNEIKKLPVGSGCEAFITSVQGKTLGHAFIAVEAERLLIVTGPGQAATLLAHFDKYLISEEVTFRDLSAGACMLMAIGPAAREGLPSAVAQWFTWGGFPNLPAQCAFVACDLLPLTLETLANAGVNLCSPQAWEILRIEQGFPQIGEDFGQDNLPQELVRDAHAISFTKGCYLGQETVARLDAMGHVNQMLVGIKFNALSVNAQAAKGASLLAGEKIVGKLTSLAWSPKMGGPLGLAIVRRGAAAVGTQLFLQDGRHGTVVQLPA